MHLKDKKPPKDDILTEEERRRAIELFNKYDMDNSGKIDENELKNLIKEHMGPKVSNMIINRFVETNINLGDKDEDRLIDQEEFMIIFKKLYTEKGGWLPGKKK